MTKAELVKTIGEAWRALEAACDSYRGDTGNPARWLVRALTIAEEQEKQHRAMGKRFTGGRASYRISCHYAACSIIIGHVYRGGPEGPVTWAQAAGYREDCALAYAIRECLTTEQLARLEKASRIDYAEDIAS